MTHESNEGVTAQKPLNRLTQNLTWVIMSVITPVTPKLKTVAPLGASGHMDEISLLCGL